MQEFILARDVIFLLGQTWLRPQTVYNSVQRLNAYFGYEQQALSSKRAGLASLFDSLKPITGIFHLRAQLRASARIEPVTLASCVLGIGRLKTCTDPRDLIYGMLGISNNPGIVCDYSLNLRQVRDDFIHKSLQSGDLSVLHYCCGGEKESVLSYIPSLERDWETEYLPVRSSNSPFKAGQNYLVNLLLGMDQALCLKGTIVDVVEDYVHLFEVDEEDSGSGSYLADVYQDVLHCLLDHYKRLENDQSPVLDEFGPTIEYQTIFEVIGSTMHPDVMALGTTTDGISRTTFWLSAPLSAPLSDVRRESRLRTSDLDHQHIHQLSRKAIFDTVRGYIGFGSHFMRPGDLVVIFDGAKTPFLIRKEMDEHGVHTGRYTIVSDCYLHGWMYGDYFGHTVLEEDRDMPDHDNDPSTEVPLCADSGDLDGRDMDTSSQAERGMNSNSTKKDKRKPILRKQTFVIC